MDDQRTDRDSGGSMKRTPESTPKLMAIVAVSSFIGAVAVTVVLGTVRHRILDIASYCLVIAPLATWAGLKLRKYLKPTR
jgi:hypothetical protein